MPASKTKTAAPKKNVYEIVTQTILDSLDKGVVPWRKPWKSIGGPRNLQSKRAYRGVNAFLLSLMPFDSPYWTTYNAAKKAGGNVRKGEKGTMVIFWKPTEYQSKDDNGTPEKNDDGSPKMKRSLILRYYTVFNVEQCDGLEVPTVEQTEEFSAVEEAERVIADYVESDESLTLGFGGDSAHYSPIADHVQMPNRERFDDAEGFYSTTYHELGHATGHESRLNRFKTVDPGNRFGSDSYSEEELVAEMTAAFLCGATGIEPRYEQSAAYIAHWSERIGEDRKLVVIAAARAQKAADLILAASATDEEEEVEAAA